MSESIAPDERVWAEVDLAAVAANAATIAEVSGGRLLPMVKADGYGLGAVAIARALEPLDPWGYGVATVAEGAALRSAGFRRPIVIFTPWLPGNPTPHLASRLTPVLGTVEAVRAWTTAAPRAPFHLEIDTGMGRAGVRWHDRRAVSAALSAAGAAAAAGAWEGIFTHFHSGEDLGATREQWSRFAGVLAELDPRPLLVHAANSAASLHGKEFAADLVRPGIFLYGGRVSGHEPRVAVRLRARVVATRAMRPGDTVSYDATFRAAAPTTIATLAAGYADGIPRALSNRGRVEIGGRVHPIAGRVTMDMTMVAVDTPVAEGSVATMYGGQVSLHEQAAAAGTISYELLTSLGPRVPRRYEGHS